MKKAKIIGSFLIFLSIHAFAQDISHDNLAVPAGKENDTTNQQSIIVEKKPEYPGGMSEFYKFISKKMKRPKSVKKDGLSGKVYVMFVVNSDGSIDDESVRVLSSTEMKSDILLDKDCELEAIRLMRLCPNWHPAQQKGIPVKVEMVVAIPFK